MESPVPVYPFVERARIADPFFGPEAESTTGEEPLTRIRPVASVGAKGAESGGKGGQIRRSFSLGFLDSPHAFGKLRQKANTVVTPQSSINFRRILNSSNVINVSQLSRHCCCLLLSLFTFTCS